MAGRERVDAREWLKSDNLNWIGCSTSGDPEFDSALVEDLYRAGAVKVEAGVMPDPDSNVADTLFVTLPQDRDKAIDVLTLIAYQQANEVDRMEDEQDVIRVWWD